MEQKDYRQGDPKNVVEQNHVEGKNHVVIGAGRDVKDIHIGHVGDNYAPPLPHVEYSTEKAWATTIHIHSAKKAAFWSSLLSFVADILTILAFFGVGPVPSSFQWIGLTLFLIFATVFAVALSIYLILGRLEKGVFQRLFGNWGLGRDESQRLTVEKLRATCPICGGRITLHQRYNLPPIGECEKNEEHKFAFDPTTMSGDPMVTTHFYPNR